MTQTEYNTKYYKALCDLMYEQHIKHTNNSTEEQRDFPYYNDENHETKENAERERIGLCL